MARDVLARRGPVARIGPQVEKTWTRTVVVVAVVGTALIDALYLAIVGLQGGPPPVNVLVIPFVAGYLATMAVLLATSLFASPAMRPVLRAAAASGLIGMGVLAAFSIGALILVMAAFAVASLVPALTAGVSTRVLALSLGAGVLAVVLLVGGFEFSYRYFVCPPTGESSGTTASLFGGQGYECNNGVLTYR